jgi:hypothetical protein
MFPESIHEVYPEFFSMSSSLAPIIRKRSVEKKTPTAVIKIDNAILQ